MPFPLAHATAALPFRRWCPNYLSFSSLVIGSLTPDMTNFLYWDDFAHSFMGSVSLCLFLGLLSLRLFHRLRAPLAAALPSPHREALLPLCGRAESSLFVCGISLLLGIWIHIGWDMFTQDHSLLARHMGSLIFSLPGYGTYQLKVNRVFWVLSTVGGAALVAVTYLAWLKRAGGTARLFMPSEWRAYANWFMLLIVPAVPALSLTYFFWGGHSFGFRFRAFAEFYLVLLYLILAIAGFVFLARPSRYQEKDS